MLKNYFKIIWRNLIREKQFTFLNILGLTIGITSCFMIGLYVYSETNYDTFHENGDRIYRVNQSYIWGDWNKQYASTGPNVAEALKADAPEFEKITRMLDAGAQTMRRKSENQDRDLFKEEKAFLAEENFFEVFSFQFRLRSMNL